MPIYEYHCNECNNNFEYLVFGKQDPEECPECSSKKINRLLSACSFKTKGAGGQTVKSSAADSSCSGCTAASCSTCGL